MWRRILSVVLSVAYPFVVWAGLKFWGLNALIVFSRRFEILAQIAGGYVEILAAVFLMLIAFLY